MTDEQLDQERINIANELRRRRQYLQLSQRDLAEKVGFKENTIERLEQGKMWLNMKQFIQLLDALGLEREISWKII